MKSKKRKNYSKFFKIDCRTVLKGTDEYDAFVDIWVDHHRVTRIHL